VERITFYAVIELAVRLLAMCFRSLFHVDLFFFFPRLSVPGVLFLFRILVSEYTSDVCGIWFGDCGHTSGMLSLSFSDRAFLTVCVQSWLSLPGRCSTNTRSLGFRRRKRKRSNNESGWTCSDGACDVTFHQFIMWLNVV
jgi:hypothetical protein